MTENAAPHPVCKGCVEIERERIIERIKNQICFDALAKGWCEHHGGKCTELLKLINELKEEETNG
jgi:hypothetical protein